MAAQRGIRYGGAEALALAIGVLLALSAHAQESTRTIRLKYRDDGYKMPVYNHHPQHEIVFKKEPDFANHRVSRMALFLDGTGKNHIGLAWDRTAGKLFLDTNRNLDLTDDEPVISDANSSPMNAKVRVPGPIPLAYRIELASEAEADSPLLSVTIRSAWEGEFDINGEPWVMTVFDYLDGKIDKNDRMLLHRKRAPCPEDPLLQCLYSLSVCSELCVEDHLLRFDYHFEPADDCSDLVLTLTDATLPSGELEIRGDGIKRMALAGPRNVLLDSPRGTVRVPAGDYTGRFVYLYDPASECCFLSGEDPLRGLPNRSDRPGVSFVVKENERLPLQTGAPLTNQLRVRREGTILTCQNQFVGVGGESYGSSVLRKGQYDSPRITARGDFCKTTSGNMEYG